MSFTAPPCPPDPRWRAAPTLLTFCDPTDPFWQMQAQPFNSLTRLCQMPPIASLDGLAQSVLCLATPLSNAWQPPSPTSPKTHAPLACFRPCPLCCLCPCPVSTPPPHPYPYPRRLLRRRIRRLPRCRRKHPNSRPRWYPQKNQTTIEAGSSTCAELPLVSSGSSGPTRPPQYLAKKRSVLR